MIAGVVIVAVVVIGVGLEISKSDCVGTLDPIKSGNAASVKFGSNWFSDKLGSVVKLFGSISGNP